MRTSVKHPKGTQLHPFAVEFTNGFYCVCQSKDKTDALKYVEQDYPDYTVKSIRAV